MKWWDATTGQPKQVFRLSLGVIAGLSFSPDGRLLAAGDLQGAVTVWDTSQGRVLHRWQGVAEPAMELTFSPDSRLLGAGGLDGNFILWELATGREKLAVKDAAADYQRPNRLVFAAQGRLLLTTDDNLIRLWDLASGRELRRLTGDAKEITCARFSPDGRRVATAGFDRTVKLWDWEAGQELASFRTELDPVGVAFSRDGLTLTAVTSRLIVKQWHAVAITP